ncbi:hypothetical protein HanPI659440_Chr15g0588271 [Helianthus annuus]|nr:hypothetical protein HanPI659440_Chr15g0588271 [Helianthus annuus]
MGEMQATSFMWVKNRAERHDLDQAYVITTFRIHLHRRIMLRLNLSPSNSQKTRSYGG